MALYRADIVLARPFELDFILDREGVWTPLRSREQPAQKRRSQLGRPSAGEAFRRV